MKEKIERFNKSLENQRRFEEIKEILGVETKEEMLDVFMRIIEKTSKCFKESNIEKFKKKNAETKL